VRARTSCAVYESNAVCLMTSRSRFIDGMARPDGEERRGGET
jgi:hypothetical protein